MELQTAQWLPDSGWTGQLPAWDEPATLVMAYGGSALLDDPGPLAEVLAAYPASCVVGCSTAGEIHGDTVSDGSLTVAVARFASTRLTRVHTSVNETCTSFAAGQLLGQQLVDREPDLQAVFVLSDGLGVNGSSLVSGLTEAIGGRAVITGGLAGDDDHFVRTWVLVDGQPQSGYVSAVGLAGPHLRVGHGSRGGWDIFGPERLVTRSRGNVLFELDGEPALQLYKTYLGARADGLPATALLFPLTVRSAAADGRQLVRTVLAVDEVTQSLTFAGDIPQGSTAQLMRANFDRIIEAARSAADETGDDNGKGHGEGNGRGNGEGNGSMLAVAVSCVGRRLVLGGRTEDELEAAVSGLPEGDPMVGFYSYGEISPVATGACDLQNQTMTITTFAETG